MSVSATLTLTPGCSPWRLHPALAALRLPSRTVAAQPTCAAQVAADMGGLAARDVRLATRPEGSLWPMAGSERSSRGPREVLLPMSASLGSCSGLQPGSWCRGFAQALPRAPLRGTRRPRRRPASPDCCCGNVAPSSAATFTGCPPSRMYELADDPR